MKKPSKLLLMLGLMIFGANLPAQSSFSWNSAFEKEVLSNVNALAKNDISWLLLIPEDATIADVAKAKANIAQTANDLKPRIAKLKTWEKQREFIQSSIKESHFKRQIRSANFQDLLEKGYYNCVTGSAFYYLILKELGIESEIVALPDHVFLKLQVNGEVEYWEAAKIVDALFVPGETAETLFLDFLKRDKLIGGDFGAFPPDFFVRNNFEEMGLNFRQVAALHYRLNGFAKCIEQDFRAAFWQFRKSYLLDSSLANLNLCVVIGLASFDIDEPPSFAKIEIAGFVYQNLPKKFDKSRMQIGFFGEMNEFLNAHKPAQFPDEIMAVLAGFEEDLEVQRWREIAQHKMDFNANCLDQIWKLECREILNEMLYLEPNDSIIRRSYLDHLVLGLKEIKEAEQVVDSLLAFRKHYGFMAENSLYNVYLLRFAYYEASFYFNDNSIQKGERILVKVENICPTQPIDSFDIEIGFAYSEGMKAYFRKADYKNAKRLLEKGLLLAPNNAILIETRQKFGRELGMKW